jgi:hypothetical protein
MISLRTSPDFFWLPLLVAFACFRSSLFVALRSDPL